MLFSEFQQGTGCRDNEHNHKVYRDLEVMYMNSDMTKDQIYEYGRKLVDNSDTPEQVELKERIKQEIAGHKSQIEVYKKAIEFENEMFEYDGDKDRKRIIKANKDAIKKEQQAIKMLKWVLA